MIDDGDDDDDDDDGDGDDGDDEDDEDDDDDDGDDVDDVGNDCDFNAFHMFGEDSKKLGKITVFTVPDMLFLEFDYKIGCFHCSWYAFL